jgi:hypothetical protein
MTAMGTTKKKPAKKPARKTNPVRATNTTFTPHIGKRCIIRSYASGVFCGEVVKQDGRMVELKDSRRLWKWQAKEGIELSDVAVNGVSASNCRISVAAPSRTVLDAIEIIPASSAALALIDACPNAKP